MGHKYGNDAKEVAEDGLGTVGNVFNVTRCYKTVLAKNIYDETIDKKKII